MVFGVVLIFRFGDSEAIKKMIIKGRSPHMGPSFFTNAPRKPAWIGERVNLDPNIHVQYVHTNQQISDILTSGFFRSGANQ